MPAWHDVQDAELAVENWPGEQAAQTAAPLAANFPAGHPSPQALWLALGSFPVGHVEHVVAPAAANVPEAQALQLVGPRIDGPNMEGLGSGVGFGANCPAAQSEHVAAPPAAIVPAAQLAIALVPSQAAPAGQAVHAVCVVLVPPEVWDPAAQVLHDNAFAALYVVSLPQELHEDSPVVREYWPAAQGWQAVDPVEDVYMPAWQDVHFCGVSQDLV